MNHPDPLQRVQDILAQIAEQQRQEDARSTEFRRRHDAEMAELNRQIAEQDAQRKKESDADKKEFNRRIEESNRRMEKFDRRMEEFDRGMEKVNLGFDKAQQTLKSVSQEWGNFGNHEGERVEDEFFTALDESKSINGVQLDEVLQRLRKRYEYDLVGINGTAVFVGEIKRRLSGSDVYRFANNRLPHFAAYFPYFSKNRQIYGMVGGLQIMPDAVEAAEECGMFVLRLKNKSLIVENNATARPIN